MPIVGTGRLMPPASTKSADEPVARTNTGPVQPGPPSVCAQVSASMTVAGAPPEATTPLGIGVIRPSSATASCAPQRQIVPSGWDATVYPVTEAVDTSLNDVGRPVARAISNDGRWTGRESPST